MISEMLFFYNKFVRANNLRQCSHIKGAIGQAADIRFPFHFSFFFSMIPSLKYHNI